MEAEAPQDKTSLKGSLSNLPARDRQTTAGSSAVLSKAQGTDVVETLRSYKHMLLTEDPGSTASTHTRLP